jgi:hypothetical protein
MYTTVYPQDHPPRLIRQLRPAVQGADGARGSVVEIDRSNNRGVSQMDNSECGGTDFIRAVTAEKNTTGVDASSFPVSLATPDAERLLKNPGNRRAWLLSKALEDYPLPIALELAQAAEAFVAGDPFESRDTAGMPLGLKGAKAVGRLLPATSEPPVTISDGGELADRGWQLSDNAGLTVLASIEDIIQYLKQHDDIAVAKDHVFVVNGRVKETFEELLARANRTRERQRLPAYTLLPAAMDVAPAKKVKGTLKNRSGPVRL